MSLSPKIVPTMRSLAQIQQHSSLLIARLLEYDSVHKAAQAPDGDPVYVKAYEMEIAHHLNLVRDLANALQPPR